MRLYPMPLLPLLVEASAANAELTAVARSSAPSAVSPSQTSQHTLLKLVSFPNSVMLTMLGSSPQVLSSEVHANRRI